jgi:predicted TIM-barrel fold metal-dependent hydrolase
MPQGMELGFGPIDADNHYYERRDSFTRHIDPKYRDQAVRLIGEGPGAYWVVGQETYSFSNINNVDSAPAPGSRQDFFAAKTKQSFVEQSGVEMIDPNEHPELITKAGRLKKMEQQGLDAIIQVPTMAVMMEPDSASMSDEAWFANLRSFNRWVEEEWGFGADGKVYSVPLISLRDPAMAVQEVERLAQLGAKFVGLAKIGPVNGKSPADASFDPVWAAAQANDMTVVFHIGNSGYTEMFSAQWGENPRPFLRDLSPFQHYTCLIDRPIADMLAAVILGNMFGRFPQLRVLVLEYGSRWVYELLPGMDKAVKMGANGTWPGGMFEDAPSDIFKEHVWVSPFPADDVVALAAVLPTNRIVFGSDFPHSEGLGTPLDYVKHLDTMAPAAVREIMRSNAAQLCGLPA